MKILKVLLCIVSCVLMGIPAFAVMPAGWSSTRSQSPSLPSSPKAATPTMPGNSPRAGNSPSAPKPGSKPTSNLAPGRPSAPSGPGGSPNAPQNSNSRVGGSFNSPQQSGSGPRNSSPNAPGGGSAPKASRSPGPRPGSGQPGQSPKAQVGAPSRPSPQPSGTSRSGSQKQGGTQQTQASPGSQGSARVKQSGQGNNSQNSSQGKQAGQGNKSGGGLGSLLGSLIGGRNNSGKSNQAKGNSGKGNKGQQGNQGAQGKGNSGKGNQGNQGAQAQGNSGKGNQVQQGNQGAQANGSSGKGNQGNQGAQANRNSGKGNQGQQGNQGSQANGNSGKGNQGNQGAQAQGNSGKGNQGQQGNQGNQASQANGNSGKGNQGAPAKGNNGQQGTQSKGNSGKGNQGNQGAQAKGSSGKDNSGKGNQGAQAKGNNGQQGTQSKGNPGKGNQGNQGAQAKGGSTKGSSGKDNSSNSNQGTQAKGNSGKGNQGNQGAQAKGGSTKGSSGKDNSSNSNQGTQAKGNSGKGNQGNQGAQAKGSSGKDNSGKGQTGSKGTQAKGNSGKGNQGQKGAQAKGSSGNGNQGNQGAQAKGSSGKDNSGKGQTGSKGTQAKGNSGQGNKGQQGSQTKGSSGKGNKGAKGKGLSRGQAAAIANAITQRSRGKSSGDGPEGGNNDWKQRRMNQSRQQRGNNQNQSKRKQTPNMQKHKSHGRTNRNDGNNDFNHHGSASSSGGNGSGTNPQASQTTVPVQGYVTRRVTVKKSGPKTSNTPNNLPPSLQPTNLVPLFSNMTAATQHFDSIIAASPTTHPYLGGSIYIQDLSTMQIFHYDPATGVTTPVTNPSSIPPIDAFVSPQAGQVSSLNPGAGSSTNPTFSNSPPPRTSSLPALNPSTAGQFAQQTQTLAGNAQNLWQKAQKSRYGGETLQPANITINDDGSYFHDSFSINDQDFVTNSRKVGIPEAAIKQALRKKQSFDTGNFANPLTMYENLSMLANQAPNILEGHQDIVVNFPDPAELQLARGMANPLSFPHARATGAFAKIVSLGRRTTPIIVHTPDSYVKMLKSAGLSHTQAINTHGNTVTYQVNITNQQTGATDYTYSVTAVVLPNDNLQGAIVIHELFHAGISQVHGHIQHLNNQIQQILDDPSATAQDLSQAEQMGIEMDNIVDMLNDLEDSIPGPVKLGLQISGNTSGYFASGEEYAAHAFTGMGLNLYTDIPGASAVLDLSPEVLQSYDTALDALTNNTYRALNIDRSQLSPQLQSVTDTFIHGLNARHTFLNPSLTYTLEDLAKVGKKINQLAAVNNPPGLTPNPSPPNGRISQTMLQGYIREGNKLVNGGIDSLIKHYDRWRDTIQQLSNDMFNSGNGSGNTPLPPPDDKN